MGKASKWFRSIFGLKKSDKRHRERDSIIFIPATIKHSASSNSTPNSSSLHGRQRQHQGKDSVSVVDTNGDFQLMDDPNDRAIAIATAAAVKAAVAAAEASTAVVRLTSSSGRCALERELAAIKIQSAYRGHLAKRALRALKGLVRMQAFVRGHIQRKRTARLGWTRRQMHVLLRAQAQARALACPRAQTSESSPSSSKASYFHPPGPPPPTPESFEHVFRFKSSKYEQPSMPKRNGSKSSGRTLDNHEKIHPCKNQTDRRIDEQSRDQQVHSPNIGPMDDEKNYIILNVDTRKPIATSKRRYKPFHSRDSHQTTAASPSGEVQSVSPLMFSNRVNSSQFYSASSRSASSKGRSPTSTPSKSDGSRSYPNGYSYHPNYLAHTESSRTKLRSLSAPKQRPQSERSSSAKNRNSFHGLGECKLGRQSFEANQTHKSLPSMNANFAKKAYRGSGRLDRLGMPVGVDT